MWLKGMVLLISFLGGDATLITRHFLGTYCGTHLTSRILMVSSDTFEEVDGQREDNESINYVLIGANGDGSDSLFQTAGMVVNHFLSSEDGASHPLRRLHHRERSDKSTELFAPLFGWSNDHYIDKEEYSNKSNHRKRINLKLTVAYRGVDFCGWEDQRHHLYRKRSNLIEQVIPLSAQNKLPSVQGTLVDVLNPIFGRKAAATTQHMNSAMINQQKNTPIELKVAGRTDAGVSAIGQICRVRIWRADLPNEQPIDGIEGYVQNLVNNYANSLGLGLRTNNVQRVGDDFHPTFGATCRAYAYLIDLQSHALINALITRDIIPKLNDMLRYLEGRELDYVAFSYGKVKTKTTNCTLVHACACLVECTVSKKQAICIELIGDRFLRRMVRILVATALREACSVGSDSYALLNILRTGDRAQAACAAPPIGLILVGAGYGQRETE